MKKAILTTISLCLSAPAAFASLYNCPGTDASARRPATISIEEISETQIKFVRPDGDELELRREMRQGETGFKFAVYLDDTYDGYGGFVKISVPKDVAASATALPAPFTAYFEQDIYSEEGKVGEVRVRATCRR